MYPKYFGLSEPSFSITPDPQYLFLSEQHREALAHLLYGAGETGGFVLLTGEVGTGKTTVCRAFLEQLPEGVEVALVLNPALTSLELMAAVCDEFGVPVPPGERSTKALLDRLNHFLLECHARGRRPVLIIDEAQNLRPVVLEQVRLLTNLETTKHKLLQIFLVGQPELRGLLASEELRQLNQRITARFHLQPLSLAETLAYIRHRLCVAGVERPLFTRAAVRRVHAHSNGVPRLINLICDRALLGAAVSHRLQANARIVDQAAREVRGSNRTQPWPRRHWLGVALASLVAASLGLWVGATGILPWPDSGLVPDPTQTVIEEDAAAQTEAPPEQPLAASDEANQSTADAPALGRPRLSARAVVDLQNAPALPAGKSAVADLLLSRPEALRQLLRIWDQEPPAHTELDCAALRDFNLACESGQGRWSDLRHFDRPAALRLRLEDGSAGEVVVLGLDDEFAHLVTDSESSAPVILPIVELDRLWSGDYVLLWRLPPGGERIIGRTAKPEAVRWLRARLRAWPGGDPALADLALYDDEVTALVRAFQAEQQLNVDGIAGPHTLILLANALEQNNHPSRAARP